MGALHHPAAGLGPWDRLDPGSFLAPLLDMRLVAPFPGGLRAGLSHVAGIGAEMLLASARRWTLHHDGVEGRGQELGVMPVGSRDDERQRDAIAVGEQAALAPFFFPCRSDWDLCTP